MSTKNGFTLIEFLIVVAIIAIIAALLLQCIGMIRDQALRTVFSSNMRQVSAGCLGYATDNRGRLPLYFIQIQRGHDLVQLTWMDLAGSYADQTPVRHPTDIIGNDQRMYYAPFYLNAAAITKSVFHDPIDRTISRNPGLLGEKNRPVCNLALVGRLQVNAAGVTFGHGPGKRQWGATGRRIATVQNSSTVGLLGPGETGTTSNGEFGHASSISLGTRWGWTPHQAQNFMRYRGGKAPVSFIDGHVEIRDEAWFSSEVAAGLASPFFDESNTF